MAIEEVLGDAAGDDGAVVVESFDVGFTHHRGDLETDVEELADVRIVERIALIVTKRASELIAGPGVNGFGGGEFREIDIDNRRVWLAERFFFREGLGVDFFGESQSGSTGFGKADDFFEPVGAGGFDVKSGTGAGDGSFDRGVNGKLIGTGMDRKFQGFRKTVSGDRMGDDREVVVEFLFELNDIADIIDSLVEASGEFRGDGLDGNSLVGDGGEDH